jgi:hypothetical protein
MIKHEQKICQRCKAAFECKVGSVALCQCSTIKLTPEERDHLAKGYSDCLCVHCMKEVTTAFHTQNFKNRLKRLLRMS